MEYALHAFTFCLFVILGAVLPGVFLAGIFMGGKDSSAGAEAGGAAALLAGLVFQMSLWGALRWAGAGYALVAAVHAAAAAALGAAALRRPEARAFCFSALRSFLSVETAVFVGLAAALAAFLTYGNIQFYYDDELFRMSLASETLKGIPIQNMLVWKGLMKYYYATEFYAASACAVTGIPLETVYFRFLLPFNWTLLFFGMRGTLAVLRPEFRRYVPHAAFLLFFLAHVKQLFNFAFRQNTFALGLSVLAVSALSSFLSTGALFPLLLSALAPALITLAKAPCGALYLALFCAALLLALRDGTIRFRTAAAAAVPAIGGWFLAYRALSGEGFQGVGSLFKIGAVLASRQEFLPQYLVPPDLLSALSSRGPAGALAVSGLITLENLLTVLVLAVLPLTAAALAERAWAGRPGSGPDAILRKSAVIVFIVGALLYCFVHFRLAPDGDFYWLIFSVWLLGAVSYPLMLEAVRPWLSTRRVLLLAAVPAIDLAATLAFKSGLSVRFAGLLAERPAWLFPALLLVMALAVYAWYAWRKRTPTLAQAVFLLGTALFAVLHYRISSGRHRELFFASTWLLAASAYPLFSAELSPRTFLRKAALLAVIPLLVALSNGPRFFYWASAAKTFKPYPWTADNMNACRELNRTENDGRLYLHNVLNHSAYTLAAMCRKRMYVSYYTEGVWEDKALYAEASKGAELFFSGKLAEPCRWLEERNIGHVYWDASGSPYPFGAAAGKMSFLERVYQGGNVSLYSVGGCGGRAAPRRFI